MGSACSNNVKEKTHEPKNLKTQQENDNQEVNEEDEQPQRQQRRRIQTQTGKQSERSQKTLGENNEQYSKAEISQANNDTEASQYQQSPKNKLNKIPSNNIIQKNEQNHQSEQILVVENLE